MGRLGRQLVGERRREMVGQPARPLDVGAFIVDVLDLVFRGDLRGLRLA